MKRTFVTFVLAATMVISSATGAGAWALFPWETPPPSAPPVPEAITATLDIYPGTINLKSNGKYVKAYLELPSGYDVADIVVSSVILAGNCQADLSRVKIGDKDEDGIPDIKITFARKDLKNASLSDGLVEVTVEGLLLNGDSFSGTDEVKIRR